MNKHKFLQFVLDNLSGTILGVFLIAASWFYKMTFYPDYGDGTVAIVSVVLFLGAMTLTDFLMFKKQIAKEK